jgi:hypothetical protein
MVVSESSCQRIEESRRGITLVEVLQKGLVRSFDSPVPPENIMSFLTLLYLDHLILSNCILIFNITRIDMLQ